MQYVLRYEDSRSPLLATGQSIQLSPGVSAGFRTKATPDDVDRLLHTWRQGFEAPEEDFDDPLEWELRIRVLFAKEYLNASDRATTSRTRLSLEALNLLADEGTAER